jgi:hypothetical protein
MACDLCGKVGVEMVDLRDQYKSELIAQVCDPCRKELDAQLWKIRGVATKWTDGIFKRWMHNRKADLSGRAR